MSLILKGIDLPNSGQIEIIIRPQGKVFSKTRGISAEAIQIPKGHGRVIDRDAVPVVRCGECKYWTGDCTNDIWQSPTDDYLPQTYADDFCSYGERRK